MLSTVDSNYQETIFTFHKCDQLGNKGVAIYSRQQLTGNKGLAIYSRQQLIGNKGFAIFSRQQIPGSAVLLSTVDSR